MSAPHVVLWVPPTDGVSSCSQASLGLFMGGAHWLFWIACVLASSSFCRVGRTVVASKRESEEISSSQNFPRAYLEKVVIQATVESCNELEQSSRFQSTQQDPATFVRTLSFSDHEQLDLPFLQSSSPSPYRSLYSMHATLEAGADDEQIAEQKRSKQVQSNTQAEDSETQFEGRSTSRERSRSTRGGVPSQAPVGDVLASFQSANYGSTGSRGSSCTGRCSRSFKPGGGETSGSTGSVRPRGANTSQGVEESPWFLTGAAGRTVDGIGIKDGKDLDTWSHQQIGQTPKAVGYLEHQNFRDGPQLESVHGNCDAEVHDSSTNVSTMSPEAASGVSPKRIGDTSCQGGSSTCISCPFSSSGGGAASCDRGVGCRQSVRSRTGGWVHGYGAGWGGKPGFGASCSESQTRGCPFQTISPCRHFAHQSESRALEENHLNPWELDPRWWLISADKFSPDAADECVDVDCDPCPCDRWCAQSHHSISSLPEEIDPVAFLSFLDKGPVIPKEKKVRFVLVPEICHFDEGVCVNDGILDSRDNEQGNSNSIIDLVDETEDFLSPDSFWKTLRVEWTKVLQPVGCAVLPVAGRHDGEAGVNEALDVVRFSDEEVWDEPEEEDSDDPFPVSFSNWQQYAQGATDIPVDQEGRVKLVTFGLRNVDLGRRDIHADSLEPTHLRNRLWSAWQDHIPPLERMEVHFVLPQPWNEVGEHRAIILLVEIVAQSLQNFRPVLTYSVREGSQVIEHMQGAYVRWPITCKTLLKRYRFWSYCAPFGFRPCELTCGGERVDIAGNGDFLVAVNAGSFCKFTIGCLPPGMMTATSLVLGFEKLAISSMDLSRHGHVQFQMRLHSPFRSDEIVDFRFPDVLDPDRLCQHLRSTSGGSESQFVYINSPEVFIAHNDDFVNFHLLETSPASATSCLVVCQTRVNGQVQYVGTKAVTWAEPPDLSLLHSIISEHFGVVSDRSFAFSFDTEIIATLGNVKTGDVLVHRIEVVPGGGQVGSSPSPRSRSRTPPRLEEAESWQDDSFGSDDDCSMLQHAIRRSATASAHSFDDKLDRMVLIHRDGTSFDHSLDEHSVFQALSQVALQYPNGFQTPSSWYQIDSSASGLSSVWLCGTAELPLDMTTVVIEWLLVDCSGVVVCATLTSIDVDRQVNWSHIAHEASARLQRSNVRPEKISTRQTVWKNGHTFSFEDHEYYQCWCSSSSLVGPFCVGDTVDCLPSGSPVLVTLVGLSGERTDAIVDSLQAGHRLLEDLIGGCSWTVVQHPHQTKNQLVAVANWECVASQAATLEVVLRGTLSPGLACCWQPTALVCDHCPEDPSWHPEGCVLSNGRLIDCWNLGIPAVHGDLILWISPSHEPPEIGNSSDAPCPCDRWCADLEVVSYPVGESEASALCKWMECNTPWKRDILPTEVSTEGFEKPANDLVPKVLISLEATLPLDNPPRKDEHPRVTVQDDTWKLHLGNESTQFAPIPDGIKLHPATAAAILGRGVECTSTEIYIDGSSHDEGAGWSVVVVSPDPHGIARFKGCIYGYVNTNDVAPTWIGASTASNIDAELQAMIVAQMVVLTRADLDTVVIRPDLQFSHHLAALKVGSKADSVLPAIVAALGSVMTQKVEVVEVRGHTGNPWNELADGLANYAAKCKLNGGTFPVKAVQHLAKGKLCREWLWWQSGSDHHKAAFPSVGGHGEWLVTPSQTNIQMVLPTDTPHDSADIIDIKVATINTCSV